VTPSSSAPSLFDVDLPAGFRYQDDFLSAEDETSLLDRIERVEFDNFEMRGVVARRRVAFFGRTYDLTGRSEGEAAAPIPSFLDDVRARAAAWAGVDADAFAMVLINEYRPGSPIGWHRDAPQYDVIAGISLGAACRMRFRPYVAPRAVEASASGRARRTATHELTLRPRSIYLIAGPARTSFEHSIPPVEALRYSITLRTLRAHARA
jgi:alkylated DNA repair dioxygenase AlkB